MERYYKYRKNDGTIRNIYYDKIQFYNNKKYNKTPYQKEGDTHAVLWDIENDGWRTIILEKIILPGFLKFKRQNVNDSGNNNSIDEVCMITLDDKVEDMQWFIAKGILIGLILSVMCSYFSYMTEYYNNLFIERSHI